MMKSPLSALRLKRPREANDLHLALEVAGIIPTAADSLHSNDSSEAKGGNSRFTGSSSCGRGMDAGASPSISPAH